LPNVLQMKCNLSALLGQPPHLSARSLRSVEVRTIPRIFNNQIFLLVVLSVVAFAVFVFTRRTAVWEQNLDARVAAIWYERGERLVSAGDTEPAIQSFRRAAAYAHGNQKYLLALADA